MTAADGSVIKKFTIKPADGSNSSKFSVKQIQRAVTTEQVDKRLNDFKDQVSKYITEMTEDLLKIRDYTYSSIQTLEDKMRQDLDEHERTIS